MGTIYLKADLSNVTAENINQFNINQLESDEVYDLIRAGHRNLLIQIPTCTQVQYYIHRHDRLTQEECETIIRNSDNIWDDIAQFYEYSTEFLMEHGEKLCRLRIEGQRNLTPEFARRHYDHLSIGTLLQHRDKFGDTLDFLITPEICSRYLRRHISWSSNKETILHALQVCNYDGKELQKINEFLNQWYDCPIDINKLIADYKDQSRAHYREDVVTQYWNNHSRKQKYENWEEYARECTDTGSDGLADTWYNSFFRGPFFELLGFDD